MGRVAKLCKRLHFVIMIDDKAPLLTSICWIFARHYLWPHNFFSVRKLCNVLDTTFVKRFSIVVETKSYSI